MGQNANQMGQIAKKEGENDIEKGTIVAGGGSEESEQSTEEEEPS